MNIFTKPNLTAWLSAVLMLLCVQTVKADVSLDQLLFIDMGDGYAVSSQPEEVLEGVLNIPAEYNGKPVVEIADMGFKEQVKLTEVNVPESVRVIGAAAFESCVGIAKVSLPEGLIAIYIQAFESCESLTEINIPSTVEKIGMRAFFRCNLNEIKIPASIKTIEYEAFRDSGLHKIIFSEGITSIGAETFAGLGSLQEIQLPSTLETIGEYAFFGNGLTEVSLPENLKSIGEKAFGFHLGTDSKLQKVIVEGSEFPEGISAGFASNDGSLAHDGSITLEAPNIIKIGMKYPSDIEGFNICHNYDVLEFTYKRDRYGDYEFYEVTPKDQDFSALTEGRLFIPGTYYKEGSDYSNWTYLPVRIAAEAFKGCKGLEYLWLSGNLKDIVYPDYQAIGPEAFKDSDLASVEQLPDEGVCDFAFLGSNTLTNVNFHEGLKTIGNAAFSGCSSLVSSNHIEKLSLPNSVVEIGSDAFGGCGFSAVSIPEGIESLVATFHSCENLYAAELPSTVKDITMTFEGCKNLEQIALPEGLKEIGMYCFSGCESLREIEIPGTVESIGFRTFENCKKLTKIEIPEGVKVIEKESFSSAGLEEIHIPQSVEMIGIEAFNCTTLKSVYYNAPTQPLVISDETPIFQNEIYDIATLYVPESALESIKVATPWCYFKDIKSGEFNGVEDVVVENNAPVEIYNLRGVKVGNGTEALTPGIYIRKQGAKCTKIAIH